MDLLTEDTTADILLRLPAASVLRARGVCRAWRRITTDPGFLAAHARRQPPQLVLYTYLDRGDATDVAMDVLPVASGEADKRRLFRYPKGACLLLASCDGVLLFKKGEGSYPLCNPATRQWAQLPWLAPGAPSYHDEEYAFYFHQQSGEHRLLCLRYSLRDMTGYWYILSTGAGEPRHVDVHGVAVAGITNLLLMTPAAVHDHLHWLPLCQGQASVTGGTMKILAFDMLSEMFKVMTGPPSSTTTSAALIRLFTMEGLLVTADFGKLKEMDLWFLEDYDAERWEFRHRVAIPWQSCGYYGTPYDAERLCCGVAVGDREGNVMLGKDCIIFVYNVRSKTVRTLNSVATPKNDVLVSHHVLQESLVQHPSFSARSSTDLGLIHFWS
ncbi:hypothetical protein ACP70R_005185 [Stipagrostis hirtigluma subsp. patula]